MAVYQIIDLFPLDLFSKIELPYVFLYNHRISGSIKAGVSGVPDKRVSLYVRGTSILVGVTVSNSDGTFDFKGLPAKYDGVELTVVIIDPSNVYNAVVADSRLTEGIGETR